MRVALERTLAHVAAELAFAFVIRLRGGGSVTVYNRLRVVVTLTYDLVLQQDVLVFKATGAVIAGERALDLGLAFSLQQQVVGTAVLHLLLVFL